MLSSIFQLQKEAFSKAACSRFNALEIGQNLSQDQRLFRPKAVILGHTARPQFASSHDKWVGSFFATRSLPSKWPSFMMTRISENDSGRRLVQWLLVWTLELNGLAQLEAYGVDEIIHTWVEWGDQSNLPFLRDNAKDTGYGLDCASRTWYSWPPISHSMRFQLHQGHLKHPLFYFPYIFLIKKNTSHEDPVLVKSHTMKLSWLMTLKWSWQRNFLTLTRMHLSHKQEVPNRQHTYNMCKYVHACIS